MFKLVPSSKSSEQIKEVSLHLNSHGNHYHLEAEIKGSKERRPTIMTIFFSGDDLILDIEGMDEEIKMVHKPTDSFRIERWEAEDEDEDEDDDE